MRDTINPRLEFDWIPAAWAAGVVIFLGAVANFVVVQPQLLAHSAFFAGIVTSFRSDFYQNSGNSAAVGTFLGVLVLTPLLVYSRVTLGFGIQGAGDIVFVSLAFSAVWLILVVVILLPLAYMGSVVGDFTRKKLSGSLGY
jgi:hypothetical protein